jgi:TRAP-type C4-dicarboxylate transport system permease small subunit
MLVAFFNVVGEKLAKLGLPVSGIPMSTELISYLNIAVVFFAAAYVQLDTGHTRVDLIIGKSKIAMFISSFVGNLLGCAVCAYVGYRGAVLMMDKFTSNARSAVSGSSFPVWPFAFILSFGFFLMALAFLWGVVGMFVKQDKASEEKTEVGGEA